MHVIVLTLALMFSLSSFAQEAQPGDACTAGQNGRYRFSGGPELANVGHLIVCDGTTWNKVLSFSSSGILSPGFTNLGSCANGQGITFDAATGGMRCGPADTIAPIWVTPAGTIETVNVNITVNAVVAASDNSGSPSYTKTGGASWLSVNSSTGAVTGKAPLSGGTYNINIRATDGAGNFSDRSFDIIVNTGGGPGDCPNPGDPCADGSIYVGEAPEGGGPYFTTPNDAPGGAIYEYNDDTTNYINTALPDCTIGGTQLTCRDGQYNTNQLITMDASALAGFQYHEAARACSCWGETHTNAPDAIVPPECSGDPLGTNALDGHGHDDWYLPALAEVDVMYVNLVAPADPDNPTWADGADGGNTSPPARDGPQVSTFNTSNGTASEYQTSSENDIDGNWKVSFHIGDHYSSIAKDLARRLRCVRR